MNLFTALISAPLMARALGPEGRGDVAAVIAAINILPIVFGIGIPLVVRRHSAKGDFAPAVRVARLFVLGTILPAVGASMVLTSTVFASLDDSGRTAAFIGLAMTPVILMWMIEAAALVGAENYIAVFLVRICQPTIVFLFLVGASVCGVLSVSNLLWVQSVAHLATLLLSSSLGRVRLRGRRLPLGRTLREGITLSGGSIAEALSYRLDQILILPAGGAHQAGLYSIASVIGSIPLAVAQAVSAPHFRDAVISAGSASNVSSSTAFREVASLTFLCSAILAVGVPIGLPAIFGLDFSASVVPTLVYLVGSYFLGCAYLGSLVLVARGSGRLMTVGQIFSLVVDIALLVVLVPSLGAVGAALASTSAYTLLAFFFVIVCGCNVRVLVPSAAGAMGAIRRLLDR